MIKNDNEIEKSYLKPAHKILFAVLVFVLTLGMVAKLNETSFRSLETNRRMLQNSDYRFVTSGTCESNRFYGIYDKAHCERAARHFKRNQFSHVQVKNQQNWGSGRPRGCSWHYYGNVELWTANGNCNVHGYGGCFCHSKYIDPRWTPWSRWGSCSKTCDTGFHTRTRVCQGTVRCSGNSVQTRSCKIKTCPRLLNIRKVGNPPIYFTIEYSSPQDTIRDLKKRIKEKMGHLVLQQKLVLTDVFPPIVLKNHRTCASYNIDAGRTLELRVD